MEVMAEATSEDDLIQNLMSYSSSLLSSSVHLQSKCLVNADGLPFLGWPWPWPCVGQTQANGANWTALATNYDIDI